jgi:hypothetical protein
MNTLSKNATLLDADGVIQQRHIQVLHNSFDGIVIIGTTPHLRSDLTIFADRIVHNSSDWSVIL